MNFIQMMKWIKKGNMAARPEWEEQDSVIGNVWSPKCLFYDEGTVFLQNQDILEQYEFSLADMLCLSWVRI